MPLLYLLLGIVRKLDRLKLDRKLDWKGGLYEANLRKCQTRNVAFNNKKNNY